MTEENNDRPAFLLINNQIFHLEKEETNIGRGKHNELVVMDLRVSRSHARITAINNRFLLVDQNSSGGTYVNGRPVVQKLLQPGDVITLAAEFKLVFEQNPEAIPENAQTYKPDVSKLDPTLHTSMLKMPDEQDTLPQVDD